MNKEEKYKLTLYEPASYQITIQGTLNESWKDWYGDISLNVDHADPLGPISILTGMFDQAALQGLLRHLYATGLPLISVNWQGLSQKDSP